MKVIMNNKPAIKYDIVCNYNRSFADSVYKDFFSWMAESIKSNKEEVISKKFVYLKSPYQEEENKILSRLTFSDKNFIKLTDFNDKSTACLEDVTEDIKDIYEFFNEEDEESKDYNHFSRLLSWFTSTPKDVDKIIYNIWSKQKTETPLIYNSNDQLSYENIFFKENLEFNKQSISSCMEFKAYVEIKIEKARCLNESEV